MEKISFGSITVFALVVFLMVRQSSGLNAEGQLLLDIKSKLVDHYNHLSNWNPSGSNPCGWNGVNCTFTDYNSVVSSLDLSYMNLSGSLSPSIGGLSRLVYLDLSFNGLSLNIPSEIGNCSNLKVLRLNNNQFEGQIPVEVVKLSSLSIFNISNNRISGPFPEKIGDLVSLTQLIAYSNNITGSLPASFGNLKKSNYFQSRAEFDIRKLTSRYRKMRAIADSWSCTKSINWGNTKRDWNAQLFVGYSPLG